MIKLNRIGIKLGLAGLVGILLSVGMLANEIRTRKVVTEANEAAAVQQEIAELAMQAAADLRTMQLGNRAVRTAMTQPEIDRGEAETLSAKPSMIRRLDRAIEIARDPANANRFKEIKQLANDYASGVGEIIGLQRNLLDVYHTRNAAVADWVKTLDEMRGNSAITGAANWSDIDLQLRDADSAVNAVQAAAWRYAALNEGTQKHVIAVRVSVLVAALSGASDISDNKATHEGVERLMAAQKKFMAVTNESIKINDKKADVTTIRIEPVSELISDLMIEAVAGAQKSVASARALAASELERSRKINLAIAMLVVAMMIGSVTFSFVGVSRPLTRLNAAMGSMAAGNLAIVIPGAKRGDEIGDIAKTVMIIRGNAEKAARDEAEARIIRDMEAGERRKLEMVKLADDFEGAVGEIVDTVSSASTELEASASTLTSTAERTQELTTLVASASGDAASNVQSVASATEEMTSSINEIGRQVQESSDIASEAVRQASRTNDRVAELAMAASRIGTVVELINTIAGQTNLLALNATIEAARAGDAGRGFAVVAAEVKTLAEQTAKATGEISQQISGIQVATQDSVNAIKQIGDTIGRMSEIASSIASAVEQQGAATQEISRNVQQAAQGTMDVNAHIGDVQRGASETGSASSQVLSAAQSLSSDSNRLKMEVSRFLDSVRAA